MKLVATNVLLYKTNSRKKLCISPTGVIANDTYELEHCLLIIKNFIMVHIKIYFYSLVFGCVSSWFCPNSLAIIITIIMMCCNSLMTI